MRKDDEPGCRITIKLSLRRTLVRPVRCLAKQFAFEKQ